MSQNSGQMNISDILLQRCRVHFEKKAQMVSSRSKKRFLYFINSYIIRKKSQCANFLNSGISTLAIQKGVYLILPE